MQWVLPSEPIPPPCSQEMLNSRTINLFVLWPQLADHQLTFVIHHKYSKQQFVCLCKNEKRKCKPKNEIKQCDCYCRCLQLAISKRAFTPRLHPHGLKALNASLHPHRWANQGIASGMAKTNYQKNFNAKMVRWDKFADFMAVFCVFNNYQLTQIYMTN